MLQAPGVSTDGRGPGKMSSGEPPAPSPTPATLPWVAYGSPSPQLPLAAHPSDLTFVAWAVGLRPPTTEAGWLGASLTSLCRPSVRDRKGRRTEPEGWTESPGKARWGPGQRGACNRKQRPGRWGQAPSQEADLRTGRAPVRSRPGQACASRPGRTQRPATQLRPGRAV